MTVEWTEAVSSSYARYLRTSLVPEETWLAAGAGRSEAEAGENEPMELRLVEAVLEDERSPFCCARGSSARLGADATHGWALLGVDW